MVLWLNLDQWNAGCRYDTPEHVACAIQYHLQKMITSSRASGVRIVFGPLVIPMCVDSHPVSHLTLCPGNSLATTTGRGPVSKTPPPSREARSLSRRGSLDRSDWAFRFLSMIFSPWAVGMTFVWSVFQSEVPSTGSIRYRSMIEQIDTPLLYYLLGHNYMLRNTYNHLDEHR